MIKVYPGQLNGIISARPKEVQAIRVLFMSAFADKATSVYNVPNSKTMEVCLRCIKALGAKIQKQEDYIVIYPVPEDARGNTADIDFKNCEPVFKQLLPLCGALGLEADYSGAVGFERDSIVPITTRLAVGGMFFSSLCTPYKVSGRLKGGLFIFSGKDSLLDIVSILCALPLCEEDSTVRFACSSENEIFVKLAVADLRSFGIEIEDRDDGFTIKGGQKFVSPGSVTIENDWTMPYLWLMASFAGGGRIAITDLPKISLQRLPEESKILTFLPYQINEYEIDCRSYPRMAIPVTLMLIMNGSNITIKNIGSLSNKRTDLLKALQIIARQFGQLIRISGDSLELYSLGAPKYEENLVVSDYGDPWLFISLVLASVVAPRPYMIQSPKGITAKEKEFLNHFLEFGGCIEIL